MKVLFISRRNNQSKYFQKLVNKLGNGSELHTIGSPTWHGIRNWRAMLSFDPAEIVEKQVRRRIIRHPLLLRFKIIRKSYSLAVNLCERHRFASYISLLDHKNPDKIALWNGLKIPFESIVQAANTLDIPVVYFENGLVPGSCSIDLRGVNAHASIPREPEFYLNYRFSGEEKPLKPISPRKPSKRRKQANPISLPEHFLFVPFQVQDDTQIVCYSHWIKTMDTLYESIITSLDAAGITNLKVVFKEHPSSPQHLKHLYNAHPNAIFANGNSTLELLEKSTAVITINSTVGLEGILKNKKVIVLGDACYRIPGLVLKADSQEKLTMQVQQLDAWTPDSRLRNNFLRFLNEVYSIPQNWSIGGSENLDAAYRRIHETDELSQIPNIKQIDSPSDVKVGDVKRRNVMA